MKLAFLFIFPVSLLGACKNGNSAAIANTTPEKGTGGDAESGNGSFSASIDGVTVTGKGTDGLQLTNTAFLYSPDDGKPKYLLFDLITDKNGDDFYSFRLYTPDKEGEFAVEKAKTNGYKCSVRLGFSLKSKDNFAIYTGDAVTVVIRSVSSSRVSGTFSGEFKLSDLSRSKPYKATVTVTDGKFDLPFSTGNLRPE